MQTKNEFQSVRFTAHLVSFLLLLFSLPLTAQPLPAPEVLTPADGLGYREVTAIAQDNKGLMWFGTRRGLNRFDGLNFKHFGPNRKDEEYFPANEFLFNSIHFINDSVMWVVADYKLWSMNMNNFEKRQIPTLGDDVQRLVPGRKNDYWIITDDDSLQYLSRFTEESGFEQIGVALRADNRSHFTAVRTDNAGNAWWTTSSSGLLQYSPTGELLHEVKADSTIWFESKIYFSPAFVDSRKRVFIFPKSKPEIWRYAPEARSISLVADNLHDAIKRGYEDSQGNIWFGNDGWMYRLDTEGQFQDLTDLTQRTLSFRTVNCFFQDRANVLWIGTDAGLFKFPVRNQLFTNHLSHRDARWGIATRALAEDENQQLYFYCENKDIGLYQIDLKTEEQAKLEFGLPPETVEDKIGLCKSLLYDQDRHSLWMMNDNLLEFKLSEKKIETFKLNNPGTSRYRFNPIAWWPAGKILMGSSLAELSFFDPATNGIENFHVAGIDHPESVETKYFLPHTQREIWVGTVEHGLYLLNLNGEVLKHFSTETEPALNNDHVLCLHLGGDGKTLWVGTFGGGVNRIHLPSSEVQYLTRQDGLSDDNVVGILEEGNDLWIATYNGLCCYHQDQRTFQNFFTEDGLSDNEFNYTSFFKSSDGQMHFGGLNGINSFFPEAVLQQELNPPLQLIAFTQYNHRLDSLMEYRSPQEVEFPVVISPFISYFQFEWTMPNYYRTNKNQFFTWLEGMDEGWAYLGSSPRIRFNQLPPGEYKLHVKGADSRGNWSAGELVIPIEVRMIFYRQWWFILLCALSLASVVFGISRYRYQRRLEMEKMRTKIASDLHDEVGSMLSGLAMQAEILEMQSQSKDKTTLAYLKDVSRSAVSKMRDMVWSIDSRRDNVDDLLDRMREHAEETFTPLDIVYEIKSEGLKTGQKLPVNVRQHLYLIYKEAATNICKHSNGDRVSVFIGNKNGRFEMSIHDNGSKFQDGKKATGLGLDNMRMRAKEIGGAFSTRNNVGFTIEVKMKKAL